MGKFQDLTGMKFGKLTVVERAENQGKKTMWRCLCECGNEKIVNGHDLKSGATKSCGCLKSKHIFKNLTGQKFERLTVLEFWGIRNHKAYWKCRCDCGEETVVLGAHLTGGHSKSCGCLQREKLRITIQNNGTHKMSHTSIYETWHSMKSRCLNSTNESYKNYGARGITVCERWLKFENFYEDVSKLPHFGEKGYTLDRINNDGDYCPENVRWADATTQNRNKRNTRFVNYNGQKIPVTEASEKSKVHVDTLKFRIKKGETGEYLFRLPTVKNHK